MHINAAAVRNWQPKSNSNLPIEFNRTLCFRHRTSFAGNAREIATRSRACRQGLSGCSTTTCSATRGDLYRLLHVNRDATQVDIKASYRRRVRRCHPDVDDSPAARKEFKAVTKAYEILSDVRLRGVYDKYGAAGVKAVLSGGPLPDLNMQKRWAGEASRGEDVRVYIELPLEESVLGCNRTVDFAPRVYCMHCEGCGFEPGVGTSNCDLCRGSGVVSRIRDLPDGSSATTITACPDCGGRGSNLEQYCTVCRGDGRVEESQSVGIKIPPGVSSGHWIKLRGRGNVGKFGGDPGDLYVGVQTQEHDSIERCGSDLYSTLEVDYADAILGVETLVANIWKGKAWLTVPPGTQHGAVLAIPGAGAPRLGPGNGQKGHEDTPRGSHYFHVVLSLPCSKAVGEEELQLLQELKDLQTQRLKARQERKARRRD